MSKQLSMNKIKEENKIYNESVDIPVTVGNEEYEVKLYPFVHEEKKRDIVEDYSKFLQLCHQENVEIDGTDELQLLNYFTIKHTTNIKFTSSKKAKTVFNEYKEAIKSKLFKVILESIPEETHNEIWDYRMEVLEFSAKLENQFKQLKEQYENLDLKNRDVIENAMNQKNTPH